jgi:hypothetical protein
MDKRVMIMCDVRASGITGEVDDSYFVRVEPRPNGGALVLWTDLPEQARVFDDAVAAAEFCRDSPLEMFVVSFVPVSAPSPRETEAEFQERLRQMVYGGDPEATEARSASGLDLHPEPLSPGKPDLSKPGALADEMRKMGLM